MKHLENYGVQALSSKELKSTDGGNWLALALIIIEAIADGKGSKNSFQAGFNAA